MYSWKLTGQIFEEAEKLNINFFNRYSNGSIMPVVVKDVVFTKEDKTLLQQALKVLKK